MVGSDDEATGSRTPVVYKTLKAAKAAGYRHLRVAEYAGEQIKLKGHTLVRGPQVAVSESVWGKKGFRLRPGEKPHAKVSGYAGEKHRSWSVYRHDQVEPKRKVHLRGPELVSLLAAVWTINRTAKRYRELASSQYRGRRHGLARHARGKKEMLYAYKGQALHYLVADGTLQHVGYHRFPGDNWAEVLTGGGFTFHRPCPTPKQASAEARTMIEAKPREIGEPRLTDAIHTVDEYLKGKDPVEIYEWPPRERFRSSFSPEQEDDEAAEAWDPDPE